MNVLAYARNAIVQSDGFVKMTDFDTLVSTSDIVSVHVPLNEQTKQLINKAAFKKMKNTTLFINTARGGIVNERDLIDALKTGIFQAHAWMCLNLNRFRLTASSGIWVM